LPNEDQYLRCGASFHGCVPYVGNSKRGRRIMD
jgi:hypothetical protein